MGHVDTNLLFSFILGFLGIVVSVVIWAASTHAARIQAREARLSRESLIDIETLNQIKRVYESAISQLEDEVRNLREQMAEREQRLRAEARSFEEKAISLDSELRSLREKMEADRVAREKRVQQAQQAAETPPAEPIPET